MKKEYDKQFNQEIERILKELYYHSSVVTDKRKVVQTELKFIQYLIKHEVARNISNYNAGKYGMQLQLKGYEVFEKYNGWLDYRKKVIDRNDKNETAKILAQRFWWIPIVISALALIFSIIAFIKS